jgi:hypothetical protein
VNSAEFYKYLALASAQGHKDSKGALPKCFQNGSPAATRKYLTSELPSSSSCAYCGSTPQISSIHSVQSRDLLWPRVPSGALKCRPKICCK